MLIRRGLDFPSPLSRRVQARSAPIPSPALRFVAVTGYDNTRHPRAHSAVDPPHSMPNWVVKHSSANDTRLAAARKSRSARGFFYCGSSSAGRALPCQGRCREFESRLPLHFPPPAMVGDFLCRVAACAIRWGQEIGAWASATNVLISIDSRVCGPAISQTV